MNKYFKFILVPILENALPETRLMDKMKVKWFSPQEEEFGMSLMTMFTSVSFLYAPNKSSEILNSCVLLNDERAKKKWLKNHLKFARKIQSINKGKTLVFKSPGNTARIAELLEIYPDAKFIHIVRDPQDVIPSTIHLYRSILPEFSLQDENKLDLTSFVFSYYEMVMSKFTKTKSSLTENQFFEFKYEDFTQNPITTIRATFDALGLSYATEPLQPFFEARKSFSKNKFNENPKLTALVNEKCSEIIEVYNYS